MSADNLIEQIKKQLNDNSAVERAKLIIENAKLIEENHELKEENKRLKDQLANHVEDIRDLRKNITQLRDENHELREENKKIKEENEILKQKLSAAERRIENLEYRLNKLEQKDEKITVREIMTRLESQICIEICGFDDVIYKTLENVDKFVKRKPQYQNKLDEVLDEIGDNVKYLIDIHRKTGNDIVHGSRSGIFSIDEIKSKIYDRQMTIEENKLMFNDLLLAFKRYKMIRGDKIVFD